MRSFSYILLLFCSLQALNADAQTAKPDVPRKSAEINKTDGRGKRDGMWLNQEGARMGEDGFSEFGNYEHGSKTGQWYKLDGEGELLAVETFRNNLLDGEVKYFDRGRLTCIGYYRGLNPAHDFDTVQVIDPQNGNEVTRIVATERGTMRHGTWRFYDADNGRLVREEDYQVDEMIYAKDFDLSKSDSAYYQKRNSMMPHNKNKTYTPPVNKQVSYTTMPKQKDERIVPTPATKGN